MSGECDICNSYDHVESYHKCGNCKYWTKVKRRTGMCSLLFHRMYNTMKDREQIVPVLTLKYYRCDKYEMKGE